MAKSWFRGHTVPPLDNMILIMRAEKINVVYLKKDSVLNTVYCFKRPYS